MMAAWWRREVVTAILLVAIDPVANITPQGSAGHI